MFQSAPHFSSEANLLIATNSPMIFLVSIRASLQQRGELSGSAEKEINISFQSAPHFSSEANHPRWMGLPTILQFQSAPHFSSEANEGLRVDFLVDCLVSIRASLQQRGEHSTCGGCETWGVFQSAPHFSSEANLPAQTVAVSAARFQSAPHFSSEANASHEVRRRNAAVSIRASLQQRGER